MDLSAKVLKRNKNFLKNYECFVKNRFKIGNNSDTRKTLRNANVKKKVVKLSSISEGHVIGLNDFLFKSHK